MEKHSRILQEQLDLEVRKLEEQLSSDSESEEETSPLDLSRQKTVDLTKDEDEENGEFLQISSQNN